MMKHLVGSEPYIEFYNCDDCRQNFSLVKGNQGIDTAKLNEVIRKGELLRYFKKLK
jgi:hypothetical protein